MIIPENKEAYLKLMKDRQRRGKPELDDQEVQLIAQVLMDSYNSCTAVTMEIFNLFDDAESIGVVTSIYTSRREVMLSQEKMILVE
ncbi:YolD-like family protein [Paenibacillus sp. FSL L8-0663]|uniref:YolD-like family protein n=1 Tax=Paenibacillus sp. FSL L8-0663 TaxID=2921606 RepID=UPI0030F8F6A8